MPEGARQHEIHQRTSEDLVRDFVEGNPCAVLGCPAQALVDAAIRSVAQLPAENPNPVLRAVIDGRLLYANRPARVLLATMGWLDGDPVPPVMLRAIRLVPREGTIQGFEVTSPHDLVFSFTLSRSSGEGHVNLYGVDITDRKHMELKLRESDRHKDEFLATLAHELRNPLAAIRNSQYLLERVQSDGEQAIRARAVIGRQVQHLTRLVNDTLDVTRIARGKIDLHRVRLDLAELVRTSVGDHRSAAEKRGLALEVRAPAEPVWVNGDQVRLAQAFENLLVNAVKFTKPGGHVAVLVERVERHALVHIQDDGVGIPPELQPTLFEPFVQADTSLHRPDAGLGLGLALVKGIVELHGGRVSARSAGAGEGAEFTIVLAESDGPAGVDAPATTRTTALPRRVLLIEDNRDVAESLRDALSLDGHDVHVATDGLDGIEAARQFFPDVVICDVGLPGVDGFEVARRLRAAVPDEEVPMLVALTGYASPEHVERARRAGFRHHLTKPVDLERLAEILARAPAEGSRRGA